MKRIITFGELLLRLTPPDGYRIGQTNEFRAFYGGSEANVAAALASYGLNSSFVSLLPNNSIGCDAVSKLRAQGVDTQWLKLVPDGRMGIYFLEHSYKECARTCTYDRKDSCISLAEISTFNWDEIFADASMFHFSGITPALSPNLYEICLLACQKAKEHHVTVSIDINYRSKLWNKEQASAAMKELAKYADILFINEDEASLLGFDATGENLMHKETFSDMIAALAENYPALLITTAARVPIDNVHLGIQAIMWYRANFKSYQSEIYPLYQVTDPNGAGDAYAAAILYGLTVKMKLNYLINFAAVAGNLKHSCRGDVNLTPLQDIKSFTDKQYLNGVHR